MVDEADFPAVVKRSRGVADGMSKGVQFLMKKNKIEVIKGNGKLKARQKSRSNRRRKSNRLRSKKYYCSCRCKIQRTT